MGLFSTFNRHGLSSQDAFEELCCQLFKTWGKDNLSDDGDWHYLRIRGAGGDGGVEAYWHNTANDDYVAIQAKWFPESLDSGAKRQIKKSFTKAMRLRPTIGSYIVCLPHNRTSYRNESERDRGAGEERAWEELVDEFAQVYPKTQVVLWDESCLLVLLQQQKNEGCRRFWFEKELLNPELFRTALARKMGGLSSRYVSDLVDEGVLSTFLDRALGSVRTRHEFLTTLEIWESLLQYCQCVVRPFMEAKGSSTEDIVLIAQNCWNQISQLRSWLDMLKYSIRNEEVPKKVDFDLHAFHDSLRELVYKLEDTGLLPQHTKELGKCVDKMSEMQTPYELSSEAQLILADNVLLVLGNQGTGKTWGLAHKASQYSDEQHLHYPLLIPASDVSEEGWLKTIELALGIDGGWDEDSLYRALEASVMLRDVFPGKGSPDDDVTVNAKCVVMVDGLDENPCIDWVRFIGEAIGISSRYERIRFVFTSRPEALDWKAFDANPRIRRHRIDTGSVEKVGVTATS